MKLNDDLKVGYELTIETSRDFYFFNSVSAEHNTLFVQQQEEYHNVLLKGFVDFFQICHAMDYPDPK